MKKTDLLTLLLPVLMSLPSCERKMNITDFSDDFAQYQEELRVEAILNASRPMSSVILIDHSIRLDDTTVFNGIDDDGDWQSYDDANGNGRWDEGERLNDDLGLDGIEGSPDGFPQRDAGEGNGRPDAGEPHVDEIDEILPLINDTTATVSLTNLNSGVIIPFIWTNEADSFQYLFDTNEETLLPDSFETEIYGGYIPAEPFTVDRSAEYELNIYSSRFDVEIRGRTRPVDGITLMDTTFQPLKSDTLVIDYASRNFIAWLSALNATTYYTTLRMKTNVGDMLISEGYSFPNYQLNTFWPDSALGLTMVPSIITPSSYRLSIWTLNDDMSRYAYSSLPINNPKVTNLRDSKGSPVMGIFGSITPQDYILIIK